MNKLSFYSKAWKIQIKAKQGKNKKHFRCKVCNTGCQSLGNMGGEALKLHIVSNKNNKS